MSQRDRSAATRRDELEAQIVELRELGEARLPETGPAATMAATDDALLARVATLETKVVAGPPVAVTSSPVTTPFTWWTSRGA